MTEDQALELYRDHCQPGDRGALERYGEKAAVAAIIAATAHMQHVAYFDEGEFHWMSGIAPRDCELFTRRTVNGIKAERDRA